MDPFFGQEWIALALVEFCLEKVLHGLYVVVGGLLRLFDPLGVLEAKVFNRGLQPFPAGRIQREETLPGEELEILHFYQYPIPDESKFRKIFIQVLYLVTIAPVDRGYCRKRVKLHLG